MPFRLPIDLEALEFLNRLPTHRRRAIYDHLRQIQAYPGESSRYTAKDPRGRKLDVSTFADLHLFYWIDDADEHIKILRIEEK